MYGNITSTRIREGAPFARLGTEKKMGRTGFFRVNPVRPGSNRVGRVIPGQHGSTRVERVTSPGRRCALAVIPSAQPVGSSHAISPTRFFSVFT